MTEHRTPSNNANEGPAFPWILDHILAYPGNYEIPLRTMYTLNSTPRSQPYSQSSPRTATFPNNTAHSSPAEDKQQLAVQAAATEFKASLMSHISQLPSQPCSLPPSFVTSFVRRCFTPELDRVDFPQALAGLDYLKDLENRRRKEVAAALGRLGLTTERTSNERKELAKSYPGVAAWVESIEEKVKYVEALYTQVYLGLRRWILINEMSLIPFNKANCLAMLNTLYPPVTTTQPTPHLTPVVLDGQRKGFFRYVQSVEVNGTSILHNIMMQGRREGDEDGWAVVRDTLDKYLRVSNGIIEECYEVTGVDSVNPRSDEQVRKSKKTDSGVSFASGDRPASSSSGSIKHEKPLPISLEPKLPRQGGSTLEKIAREIRKMRSKNEIRDDGKKESKPAPKGLKKMKSAGALVERDRNLGSGSSAGTDIPAFDVEEMKRKRLLWEARQHRKMPSNEL